MEKRHKTVEEILAELAEVNDFKAPSIEDNYGVELIMDIHEADASKFNKKDLEEYCIRICEITKMRRADLHWWDFEGQEEQYKIYAEKAPHLCGISLCQFLMTSNMVIHTIDPFQKVYINLFTCKVFEKEEAMRFTEEFFRGKIVSHHFITRI